MMVADTDAKVAKATKTRFAVAFIVTWIQRRTSGTAIRSSDCRERNVIEKKREKKDRPAD
jgi:hypothetical protein